MSKNCAAIVLAAGASTRLGQPKQLLRLNEESLLRRSVRLAAEADCSPIFVVLGFESMRMKQELQDLDIEPVINSDWKSGMGSSLRCGIEALIREIPAPQRVLLLLCDQIKLSSEILSQLLLASEESSGHIIASRYAERLGVPAIFPNRFYADLLHVEGDQGARTVIQQHAHQVIAIDFPNGAIDIDTALDLKHLTAS
ncbi:NTP transferase domain-containing protein [Acidobacterium sp. S8]|uniref:nucleotidyltransferase family protein n=1 Tax=Acidobacterium sp. S8 TaxID=1641854 RepID=UPI00131DA784|nr:nucleotidyltransferase family protein [Acidobacterium sp. S8]